jgi:dienelactone hydrolase
MAEVILFHHALGLTDGVRAFADDLRQAGHRVTTPDLFEGRTFSSIEEGVANEEAIGWEAMIERSEAAVADLPADAVYGGFSLGSVYAQRLVQMRPGALGALLLHGGGIPPSEFEVPWPTGVPMQIHASEADPWVERETVDQVVRDTGGEAFFYPGSAHLFTDRSWHEYDETSTALVLQRTLAFLDRWS